MPEQARRRATAQVILASAAPAVAPRAAGDLLHELQVHQIELEMQNHALRDTQVALEESRDRYQNLYDFAPVGYLTLGDTRLITAANRTGAALLGEERHRLLGRRFEAFVAEGDRDRWDRLFFGALKSTRRADIEMALQRRDGGLWHARLDCLRVDAADGQPQVRVVLVDVSVRKRLERELAAASRRVAELSRHMVDAQEDARRRLSSALHDRTSPNLAAIKINLGILAALPRRDAAAWAERLEDTRALVADTDASVREIATELRPPLLDYAGLVPALAGYARQFAKRTGLAVRVDCSDAETGLAPVIESLLFRIFQEALSNCARHASASAVTVTLRCDGARTLLLIADDGIGFDTGQPAGGGHAPGLGLLNMREMAEFAGGHCTIDSLPGHGTRIEVAI